MVTQEQLRELLDYDQETGIFTWKVRTTKSIHIGDVAGNVHITSGYRRISIFGSLYYAHRLAWLYVYGKIPLVVIDHKNSVRDDNRIVNLREANRSQNSAHRAPMGKSGFMGVCYHKRTGKWRAKIRKDHVERYLGIFDAPEAAGAAYDSAAKVLHGEFAWSSC